MSLIRSTLGYYFARSLSSFQPHYNYGLPGKGKSRSHLTPSSAPNVQGEVLFGLHPIILALQAGKRKAFYNVFIDSKFKVHEHRSPAIEQIFELASQHSIPVKLLSGKVLDHLAGNRPHQGVCLDAEHLEIPEWNNHHLFTRTSDIPLWLLLHNVKDPMNFGAILRTAHYFGVDQVMVPDSNSCKLSPVVNKASAGALEVVNLVKLSKSATEVELCKWWQLHGGIVVGTGATINEGDRSILLEKFTVTSPTLLILGNEGVGLGEELEDCCDKMLTIPCHEPTKLAEKVHSLNVSVAAGILLHWIKTTTSKNMR